MYNFLVGGVPFFFLQCKKYPKKVAQKKVGKNCITRHAVEIKKIKIYKYKYYVECSYIIRQAIMAMQRSRC